MPDGSHFVPYICLICVRFVFKIKDGCKLELQTPETMKMFSSTKKTIYKTKSTENVASLELVDVVLVQCHVVDNQYQQKSKVLYSFLQINLMLIC